MSVPANLPPLHAASRQKRGLHATWNRIAKGWQLYLIILLPLLFLIIFRYVPMYGIVLGFKQYYVTKGILGSPWVGLKHFDYFFQSPLLSRLLINTVSISIYSLLAGFPMPIILALSLNEIRNLAFKKSVQMITYAPYFISTVVMVSIVMQFLNPTFGIVNTVIKATGAEAVNFMGMPKAFIHIYVWSGVWQYTGYSSVIFIAALSAIDPEISQAAIVDGATRLQRIWHIDLPGIMPTAVILLILNAGQMLNVGFEKVYLMQNNLNMSTADVISTYVYRMGLLNSQFSYATAVGLFNSAVNLFLLVVVNQIARKFGDTSLW